MGSRAVNLEKHSLALLAAKGDVVSGRAAASWALFTYEKANDLKLLDSGAGGPDELAKRFQSGSIMYGLCRLLDGATGEQHVVLINWVGEKVSDQRRQACAGHLPAIRAFFKEANLVVTASLADQVTQDGLTRRLSLAAPPGGALTKKGPLGDLEERVGTNYKKTNPALEILHTQRSSFWAQAEREEEERREAERRRAQEERRRWERQRMEEERRQAAERERRIQEKEQLIHEQRKLQAQREAEERREEETRRQREAAALASQRPHNPWGFFQQRERSGSASERPSSPGGQPGVPRRPFLRYQSSLTESAYIFRRPDPPPSPSSGDFLPSMSPPGAVPLPSPRQPKPKPPPPISPKPGPGAAPSTLPPTPPETGTPPHPTLMATGPSPSAGVVGSACPLSEPEGATSPSSSPPGPCRASAPPLSSPPQARPLADSPQRDSSPPGETDSCSLPGACHKGALPHTGSPDHWGGPSQAEREGGQPRSSPAASPPTNGFPQEEGSATADDPPAPASSQAKLIPSSGHNGTGAMEEGKWARGHEVGAGGQVDPLAGTKLLGTALGDHGEGEGTRNGDQSTSVENRGHAGDPCLQVAEA